MSAAEPVQPFGWQHVKPMDAPEPTTGSPINPMIGFLASDTLENVQSVLALLQDASEAKERHDADGMGAYHVLQCCRLALSWESENYHARAGRRRVDGAGS